MTDRPLWLVVPHGFDDPGQVSGGNVYDQRLRDGLAHRGWDVRMLAPRAPGVAEALAGVPRGGVVLIDGLVAGWAPEAVEGAVASGIRIVVLAHMCTAAFPDAQPAAIAAERRAFRGAERVIATSEWTAGELIRRAIVDADRVSVARPGVSDDCGAREGAGCAGEVLCVGVIAPHKGQDVLLAALARLEHREWSCTLAGSARTAPDFAARVAHDARRFDGRVRLAGVLTGGELARAYAHAGVLVAPSRVESFGMAIADARSRGLPVIASATGGIGEAVAGGGAMLVPPGDPEVLAHALWRWLAHAGVRDRLRAGAADARAHAPRWDETAARVDVTLGAL